MKKLRFTLLELLISLTVFLVIFVILLRFVAGGQQLWRGMERKNETYATARVALNVIDQLLDGVVAGSNYASFVPSSGSGSQLCFLTNAPLLNEQNATTSQIYAVKFAVDSSHRLMLTYSNTEAASHLKRGTLATTYSFPSGSSKTVELTDFVTGFTVEVVEDAQTTKYDNFSKGESGQAPRGIEVTVKTMKKEDFDVWKDLSSATEKNNFAAQHEYVFTRTFSLPEVSRDLSQL